MKKRRRIYLVIIGIILVLLLGIIGIWWLISNQKDNEPPQITLKNEMVSLYVDGEWDPDSYIQSVTDPEDGKLKKSDTGRAKSSYWYVSDVDMSKAGEYTLRVVAMDQEESMTSQTIKVTVKERSQASNPDSKPKEEPVDNNPASINNNGGYDENIDPNQAEPCYVNGILLVNKNHPLPKDFGALDPTAASALAQLQAAAQSAGYSIPTVSGYRSYDYQAMLYNGYVQRDGQAAADTYSDRPGCSEHQTGLAFDVGAIDNNYGNTAEGQWLAAHCHEFGFIIRYQQGKESITGYMYEPWHIRYVGVNAATEIAQRGITLEEYLGVY